MKIKGVKFRIRDLIYGALVAVYIYGFVWMALAFVEPGNQAIIEWKSR